MTIDDKIEIPEQLPLFIRYKDFRFSNELTYFYFIGKQEKYKGLPELYLYNAEKSGSTYTYRSIMGDKKKDERWKGENDERNKV